MFEFEREVGMDGLRLHEMIFFPSIGEMNCTHSSEGSVFSIFENFNESL